MPDPYTCIVLVYRAIASVLIELNTLMYNKNFPERPTKVCELSMIITPGYASWRPPRVTVKSPPLPAILAKPEGTIGLAFCAETYSTHLHACLWKRQDFNSPEQEMESLTDTRVTST